MWNCIGCGCISDTGIRQVIEYCDPTGLERFLCKRKLPRFYTGGRPGWPGYVVPAGGHGLGGSNFTPNPVSNPVLSDALAYYALSNTTDSTGHGYTLTNNNSVTFSAGKVGNAGTFADGMWFSNADAVFAFASGDFTVCAWYKITDKSADRGIVDRYKAATVSGWSLFFDTASQRIQAWVADGTTIAACTGLIDPDTSTWYFVTLRWIAATKQVFLHENAGAARVQNNAITGIGNAGHAMNIGASQNGGTGGWIGQIDEVVFFTRDIGMSGITYLYNGDSGRTWPI